jgi:hypothetical protein
MAIPLLRAHRPKDRNTARGAGVSQRQPRAVSLPPCSVLRAHILTQGERCCKAPRDITRRAIDAGRWQPQGKTPEQTLNAQLTASTGNETAIKLYEKVGYETIPVRMDKTHW